MTLASGDVDLVNFMTSIGWRPGRDVDLTADLQAWSLFGYAVPDAVREFMAECSGLEFTYPRHPAVGGLHSCLISGVASSRRVMRSLVTGYEERLGRGLCPIGQSASGNLFLYMASDGSTYGGHDRFLAKISRDGYRALRDVRNRAELVQL
ncbi:hypothetical protein GTZ85_07225 [Streptomyces sp. SID5474]|nr:hypothetical protein [Streptomyces sp. SID5474]